MDPRSSAQDVHLCDLCETAIVHSYCDFCHVNLCKPCVVDHISDGYHKHSIVPFQERRSTLIYPKCGTHPNKSCDLHCKDCNMCVCSSCMASDQHKGHSFVEVTEVYKTKKDVIEKEAEELENRISPSYEEIAIALENQISNLNVEYEKLTTTMFNQGEQWHKEIDIIINKMKTEINEIKVKHRNILQKQLDEVKQIQSLIKHTFMALKEFEKSIEISLVIEYRSKIRQFSILPPKVKVSLPTFIPKPIDCEKLYSLFGDITPLSTATEHVLSLNKPKTSVRELLDEPELVATIQTGHEKLLSVTCLDESYIWTSGLTDDIICFNNKDVLLQIKTKSGDWPSDITVDRNGDLLFSDRLSKTLNKVKYGRTEELIRLHGWTPSYHCVTTIGDLLVTMSSDDETQSKVVRYTGSSEKQTIQFDNNGKPLYSGENVIKYITENKNNDICVADHGAGAVVVVNQDGKLRWRYTGHPLSTNKFTFKPCGITTDSQSHILTADRKNHCIHILDQSGEFLRHIHYSDLKDPCGINVDKNDDLFVCEFKRGNLKKIKYLK